MAIERIAVLLWMDILAIYAMYIMMTYLTDVWKLGFTHAAGILNVFWGVAAILPILQAFIADTIMGNYWMLLISSMAYSAVKFMILLQSYSFVSRPIVAVDLQHVASLESSMAEQFVQEVIDLIQGIDSDAVFQWFWRSFFSTYAIIIVTCAAVLALPYIKPWSLRFGIPAICTLFATLLFFSGSCSYRYIQPDGSPLTTFILVFVAAFSKLFHRTPKDPKKLYEIQEDQDDAAAPYLIPHTKSLRCLDKASIVIPTKPLEEQQKNRWKLCRVTEVEETKTMIRMIPVWLTFILCGVVSAIGLTYFVEQLNHLNPKVGRLKVPIVVILCFYLQAQNKFAEFYACFANCLGGFGSRKVAPPIGIATSMILAILCCMTAAKVEDRRFGVVQKHGLVNKPDETVPMTMFWLLLSSFCSGV